MTMHELKQAMFHDQHLQCLKDYIIQGWSEIRHQITQDMNTYWTFRDDMAVIDRVTIKDRHILVLETLQKQTLQKLHFNHMDTEKNQTISLWLPFTG